MSATTDSGSIRVRGDATADLDTVLVCFNIEQTEHLLSCQYVTTSKKQLPQAKRFIDEYLARKEARP